MQFDLPKEQSSIIKVIGVGGGGSNAVNYMYEQGIRGVNFVICNTDGQAMELSPIPNKIQLGPALTEGLGAGSNPEIGRQATEESFEDVKEILEKNTKMVFVTAGMGGGTGTGGAPVIAKIAREMNILTVGIVTTPFFFEGRRKMLQAQAGIDELRNSVDSLIVISNDKIREIYGNLTRSEAFAKADNILSIAAKSISEIITVAGQINVDFADVEYVMKSSGVAIMGSGIAEGEDRAARAVQGAMSSPLLNDNSIQGAKKILLNISSGTTQVLIDEITEIHEFVLQEAGTDADVIFGTCDDESLGDKLSVTVIATGFEERANMIEDGEKKRIVHTLDNEKEKVTTPVTNAVEIPKPVQQVTQPPMAENEVVEEEEKQSLFDSNMTFDFELSADSSGDDDNGFEMTTRNEDAQDVNQPEKEMEPSVPTPAEIVDNVEPTQRLDETAFVLSSNNESVNETEKAEDLSLADRFRKLRNLNLKMKSPKNITELENEPAYKRRQIELNNSPHSSESSMSKYSLSEGEDEGDDATEIKRNNSFLHDNVD